MKWLASTSCLAALLACPAAATRLAAQQGRDSSYQTPPSSTGPTLKVGGYIQARETWQEAGNVLTGTLNRARAYVEGNLTAGFTYRIMAEYEAGGNASTAASVSLRDAYIRWTRNDFVVWAGQFKTPFSPEFIMSITQVETADRATVVDTLAPKRDIGVMATYAFRPYVTLAAGFFNGEGQNRIINVDSANMVVARATVCPIPFITFGGISRSTPAIAHAGASTPSSSIEVHWCVPNTSGKTITCRCPTTRAGTGWRPIEYCLGSNWYSGRSNSRATRSVSTGAWSPPPAG
jgi:hypothetical protein